MKRTIALGIVLGLIGILVVSDSNSVFTLAVGIVVALAGVAVVLGADLAYTSRRQP